MQILDLASHVGDVLEHLPPRRILSNFLLSISVPPSAPNEQIEQEALWHFRGVRSLLILFLLQINSKGWLLFLEANTLLLFWFQFLHLDNHADNS